MFHLVKPTVPNPIFLEGPSELKETGLDTEPSYVLPLTGARVLLWFDGWNYAYPLGVVT